MTQDIIVLMAKIHYRENIQSKISKGQRHLGEKYGGN